MKHIKKQVFLFAALLVSTWAQAGGGGGGIVFDPTNYMKNMLTAAQTAQSVTEQVGIRLHQLEQLQEMYRQGKSLASGDLSGVGTALAGPALGQQISDMRNMYSSLSTMNGDVSNLRSRYNYAMQMAQRYGLTLKQYQEKRAEEAKKNIESAQLERDQNLKAMQSVQSSYETVQKWQNSMPDTNTQLFQRMNQQMSLVNTQNAQILQYYIAQDNRRIDNEAKEAATKEAQLKDAEDRRVAAEAANKALNTKIASESKSVLDRLKAK